VIEGGEELGDVKCKCTRSKVFNPFWLNNVGKSNPYIHSRSLFETSELTRVDEIVGNHKELKMFSNHFFEEFSYCIKKNDRAIWLGWIIRYLVRFRNNKCHWCLEMRRPMSQIHTDISDINEFTNAIFVSDDRFDMTPR